MSVFTDMNKFYREGFSVSKMSNQHYQVIKSLLDRQKWVKDQDKLFTALPEFFSSGRTGDVSKGNSFYAFNQNRTEHLQKFPVEYLNFIQGLFLDPMVTGDWQQIYDLELRYLDLWDGAEDNPWHFEGSSDADIVFLIYLTDEKSWQKEWGGYLDLGERIMNRGGLMSDFSEVKELETVLPDNRNIVLMHNRKLSCVHRSFSLAAPRQRITLTGEIKFRLKESFDLSSKVIIPPVLDSQL